MDAGLASSAALELAAIRAFAFSSDLPWHPDKMATIAHNAEQEWIGVSCGIMDQTICALGQTGQALLVDCRSLDIQQIAWPEDLAILVLDTKTRRTVSHSAYNQRRLQCQRVAQFFGVAALRDVNLEQLQANLSRLDPVLYRRAHHVITENQRTLQAVNALKDRDVSKFGKLLDQSHQSLRIDFEVSSSELDAMVTCARQHSGCWGARMTGAGFGGSAVAIIKAHSVTNFVEHVNSCYQATTGLESNIYVCSASNGVEIISTSTN